MAFTQRHLLGLEGVPGDDIVAILDTAASFKEISERDIKKVPALRGKTIINLFYEASTRTRTSFEIAAKRLSADTVNISASSSSVSKGETLADTARNLEAMKPDAIVVRHPSSGACSFLARHVGCPILNAGDGCHEHPTQALLDCLTTASAVARSPASPSPSWVTCSTAASAAPTSTRCGRWAPRCGWLGRPRCCPPSSPASASSSTPGWRTASATPTSS